MRDIQGGSGLIEEFLRRYAEDPRRFFSMVRAALEMGEFELIDHQLVRLIQELADPAPGSEAKEAVGALREAQGHEQLVAMRTVRATSCSFVAFSPLA